MKRFGFTWWGVQQPAFDGEGGSGAGGAGGEGGSGKGGDGDKVTLSNAELETLIKGRVDSAVALATKKAGGGMSEAEKAELETLRKMKEEQDRKDKEARGQYDAALKSQEESIRKEYEPKLTAAEEKAKVAQQKLEERVIGLAVAEAAGKMNAVNPSQVRQLLAGALRMNDQFEAIVVDDAGNQRFVAGKPMTPDQLVKEFLDANPHLVRSTAGAGGGAGGGKSLTDGDAGPIAEQEAKVKKLEEEYKTTRDPRTLTKIRLEGQKLTELKQKKAS